MGLCLCDCLLARVLDVISVLEERGTFSLAVATFDFCDSGETISQDIWKCETTSENNPQVVSLKIVISFESVFAFQNKISNQMNNSL